jgi:gliding motility-associated protein GldM
MALPKDPRQLMINLMYLVLTAMLALNITKEVLTAFQTINTSIEGSITSITGKNDKFYSEFDRLAADPQTKEEAEKAKAKAAQIKERSTELMKYLSGFKDTVITRSGGMEEGPDGKQEMKGLDNIDVSTKLFVEEKKGEELKKRMEDFKSFIISQVDPSFKSSMEKSIPIQLSNPEKSDENPTGDWSFGTFHNIPVVATVAMLSKFQNDVKNSESIVLENLLSQIGVNTYKFDALQAIATPTTSYALEGQEIEATVILAAYSKSVNPNMGPGVVVKDGVGTMKFKASGVGQQTKSGTVSITKGGKVESYPYKFNYMVGTAGASLQLDKMNVMYIGVPNPISLSASGYNIEDVSLSLPGATLTSTGKGHYTADVTKEGKIEWTILGKSRTAGGAAAKIGGGEIRVKSIPDPTATIGGKSQGYIPTAIAKAQEGIVAKVIGFDFETTFKVTSFRFVYLPKIGDPVMVEVNGNRFSGECAPLLQRSRPGDRWVVENVKAVGPDKKIRSINGIILNLN